jgi:ubiquinone biosynthesis protein UbiJ
MSGYDWLEEEEVSLFSLCASQGRTLTKIANALRGTPPELTHWSHHDLAQRARDVVAENKRLRERVLELEQHIEEANAPRAPVDALEALTDRSNEVFRLQDKVHQLQKELNDNPRSSSEDGV